jgi:hypothetical protein
VADVKRFSHQINTDEVFGTHTAMSGAWLGVEHSLAPRRLPPVLAVEIPLPWRPTATRRGSARADQADEHGKSTVGCAAYPWLNLGILQRTSVGVDNAIAAANINAV